MRVSRAPFDGTVWRQGRRQPSLHMDVRFLACPNDAYTTHAPQRNYYKPSQYHFPTTH